MCGLVFLVSGPKDLTYTTKREVFEELMYASILRGDDATGVFATSWDHTKHALVKRALPSDVFLQTKGWGKIKNDLEKFNVLIGHTRAATIGTRDDESAHPFIHKHITLAHNGHIRNHYSLGAPLADTTDVDSDKVAWAFAHTGVEETLKKLEGDFTFLWYDSNAKTFNFIRNERRPLFFVKLKNYDVIVGGSELKMIEWVLDRNNLDIAEKFRWRANEPDETRVDYRLTKSTGSLFTFDSEMFSEARTEPLGGRPDWGVKKVDLYVPPYYPPAPKTTGGYWDGEDWDEAGYHNVNGIWVKKDTVIPLPFQGSEKKDRDITALILSGYGLKRHDEVLFHPWSFIPYAEKTPRGAVYGFIESKLPGSPKSIVLMAMAHGVEESLYGKDIRELNLKFHQVAWKAKVYGVQQKDANFGETLVRIGGMTATNEASMLHQDDGTTFNRLFNDAINLEINELPKH